MDIARLSVRKIAKIVAIVVVAFIVGAAVFMFFMIRANAKAALRNAKNIRVALQSADIKGTYKITAYDSKNHELTGMTYREGNYIVTFTRKNGKVIWDVDYRMNVYTFDDDD